MCAFFLMYMVPGILIISFVVFHEDAIHTPVPRDIDKNRGKKLGQTKIHIITREVGGNE